MAEIKLGASALALARFGAKSLLGLMNLGEVKQQLPLPFRTAHGGARRGAGRKRLPPHLRHTPHRTRGTHRAAHPVHVTLRARWFSLRQQTMLRAVLGALRASNRGWFRTVHYSVQQNHIHLIVEAQDARTLASSMRGLVVRIARRVNRLLRRKGRFWADRWHGEPLTSPRQVRSALVYVLQNWRKHQPRRARERLDPCSSAEWFTGFVEALPAGFRSIGPPCVTCPQTWLLRVGWRRHGNISQSEAPCTKGPSRTHMQNPLRDSTPSESLTLREQMSSPRILVIAARRQ